MFKLGVFSVVCLQILKKSLVYITGEMLKVAEQQT